jgi:hypothetical protein
MSTPQRDHDRLSSAISPTPRTHLAWPGLGGLSSLHPSRSSGFSPPRCYQASSALSPQYFPRICHPLPPLRLGISSAVRRSVVYDNPRRQGRRASLGKTHHLPVSRPASCQLGSPDIRPRLVTSARPPRQHHLAGSLFATYTGSASCFLQTRRFPVMPLPCWRRPSVR